MDAARTFTLGKSWSLILRDVGVSPGDVLRRAGMPDDLFSRDAVALTPAEYYRLWEAFEAEADDPELPITLGRTISVEAFEPPIFAALCSHDLDVAVERITRYNPSSAPSRSRSTAARTEPVSSATGPRGHSRRPRWRPSRSCSGWRWRVSPRATTSGLRE